MVVESSIQDFVGLLLLMIFGARWPGGRGIKAVIEMTRQTVT